MNTDEERKTKTEKRKWKIGIRKQERRREILRPAQNAGFRMIKSAEGHEQHRLPNGLEPMVVLMVQWLADQARALPYHIPRGGASGTARHSLSAIPVGARLAAKP